MGENGSTVRSRFPFSIVDVDEEERRDQRLAGRVQAATGKRGQPPQVPRLRAVTIYVEHLERRGTPFRTARNSKMNKLVRAWLNERMAKTGDTRKSRRGTISLDAVTDLLKQVAELRK